MQAEFRLEGENRSFLYLKLGSKGYIGFIQVKSGVKDILGGRTECFPRQEKA